MVLWLILGAWFFIPLIVAMIIGLYTRRYNSYEVADFFADAGAGWMIGFIPLVFGVGGLALGVGSITSGSSLHENKPVDTSLYALDSGSETTGHFFLGSGYVGSHLTYDYIVKEPDGGFELKQVNASGIEVYQKADTAPVKVVQTSTIYDPILLPWNFPGPTRVSFVVPVGSVEQGYDVSASGH